MTPSLYSYTGELAALDSLFGKATVAQNLPRLQFIHDYTEAIWHNYVSQIPDSRVNYLLIAEAPPWSAEGRPRFALNSVPSGFLTTVCKTFDCHDLGPSIALPTLAARGFLLLDSIPFSMIYAGHRDNPRYNDLVRVCTAGYVRNKIESSGLHFSPDLRIAFSLKLHARSILKALRYELHAGDRTYPLSEDMIAANGAGYPCAKFMRAAFGLPSKTTHAQVSNQ